MKKIIRHTESDSNYRHLEKMAVSELLKHINDQDKLVPLAVELCLPMIGKLVSEIIPKMKEGGRLFYIGAGTSGRLGIVDASECPPTFGVPEDWVIGLMAGGDGAMRKAVEFAEDDEQMGWKDLESYAIDEKDVVIGIAASGTTPYVVNALKSCRENGILTGSISCNENTPLSNQSDYPIAVIVGPEFVTGSTRMKSGTAQKLVLNMISTAVMIGLGRVVDNKMVDMQLSNNKLVDRGTKLVMNKCDVSYDRANEILLQEGSVRNAISYLTNQ